MHGFDEYIVKRKADGLESVILQRVQFAQHVEYVTPTHATPEGQGRAWLSHTARGFALDVVMSMMGKKVIEQEVVEHLPLTCWQRLRRWAAGKLRRRLPAIAKRIDFEKVPVTYRTIWNVLPFSCPSEVLNRAPPHLDDMDLTTLQENELLKARLEWALSELDHFGYPRRPW